MISNNRPQLSLPPRPQGQDRFEVYDKVSAAFNELSESLDLSSMDQTEWDRSSARQKDVLLRLDDQYQPTTEETRTSVAYSYDENGRITRLSLYDGRSEDSRLITYHYDESPAYAPKGQFAVDDGHRWEFPRQKLLP